MIPGKALGRQPADPAQLARLPQLADHRMAAAQAPARLARRHIAYAPAMDGNDAIGDCTAVGIANAARAVAALGGWGVDIPTQRVIDLYAASTGYVPGDPATDQGGVEADVLLWQARNGFDTGGQTALVAQFMTHDPADLNAMRLVMAHCGVAYLGVDLALADQTDGVWDTETPSDQTPGSWGGHCLCAWSYSGTADTDLVYLATWGMLQRATWRWVRSRCQESHALLWRQFGAVSGVDYDLLEAEVLSFTSSETG